MRSAVPLLLALAIACSSEPARTDAAMSEAERAAIADTVKQLSEAIFDGARRVNAEETFQRFAAGADAAHLNSGARYTRDSLLAGYRPIFASLQSQTVTVDAPTITVLGRDAGVYSTKGQFTATPKTGTSISSDGAWTFVWVRRDGQWTLLHSHQSIPKPLPPPGGE